MKYLIFLFITIFGVNSLFAAYTFNGRGWIEHKRAGQTEWKRIDADSKIVLREGDELRTLRASSIEIYMDDGSRIKLAPLSSFKLRTEKEEKTSIGLFFGRLRSWVKRKLSRKFEVRTPSAVCAVRGTDFTVAVGNNGNTRVEVYSGSVLTGDAMGRTALVSSGQMIQVTAAGGVQDVQPNPNPPSNMESSVGDARLQAKKELYNEISKDSVMKAAQMEMQSAEYKLRKVAIDAFGYRVRMEEYIIRPQSDQFKYVVINNRQNRFDFGKILFTFNKSLPEDLSLATRNMTHATGSTEPQWQLTDINSIMSNTRDKVTEEASGGHMVADNPSSPTEWNLFFTNYAVYAQGGDLPLENGGKGKMLWSYSDSDFSNSIESGEITYLAGSAPSSSHLYPDGSNVFHDIAKNTYSDGTWIQAEDFVIFNDGKVAWTGDFASKLGVSKDILTDKLNFERVYTSSLFNGRKIDLVFSAKLLKDAGLINFN